MKYKFKAFFQPFIMMFIYFYMPYILNKDYGWICEGPGGCSRIPLINFWEILNPQTFEAITVFMTVIIPVIFLLLTTISLFLGVKFLINKNKYEKTSDQYSAEKLQKVTTSIKKHTLVFLFFFIMASIPKLLFSLSKDNPNNLNTFVNTECPLSGVYFNPLTATFESC